MSRPHFTCLCAARDVCPVHDELADDEVDAAADTARAADLDDQADARADRARDDRARDDRELGWR